MLAKKAKGKFPLNEYELQRWILDRFAIDGLEHGSRTYRRNRRECRESALRAVARSVVDNKQGGKSF